jgi:small-conductance mechanosensitive channel
MSSLTKLLFDILDDLRDINFLWQLGTAAFSFALAWFVASYFKKKYLSGDAATGVMKIGVESFNRVIFPLLAMLFIAIAKPILAQWQSTNLFTLLFPIIGSFAFIRFGFYMFRRTFVKDGTIGTALMLFERLFAGLVWLGLVLHFTGLWSDIFQALESVVFPFGKSKITLLDSLKGLISVVITLLVAMWLSAILEARLMQLPTMHTSLKAVLSRFGRGLMILIAVLASLAMVGIDLTVLSVFGGALGVGLGLGLQKIASSYVSGFVILIDRSVTIGDMITVDKFNGTITDIKTRYTVLKGLDGSESIIPNEMLVATPVQNFSFTDKAVAMFTEFTVAYDTDIEALFPYLLDAVRSIERVSKNVEPSAMLMRFAADGLELRVGFWIEDPENGRSNILSEVNRSLWKVMKEHKIQLPYPQRTVHLADANLFKPEPVFVNSVQ